MFATSIRKLVLDSSVVTLATGVSLVCSMLSLGFNTRALGVAFFGQLALVQALVSFISGLTTFDNWQPIVRLGIRSPRRLGLVITSGIALDVGASMAAAAVAGACLLFFLKPLGLGNVQPSALIPFELSLLVGLSGTPKGYFRLRGEFAKVAQNQIAIALLQLGFSVILWYFSQPFDAYLVAFGLLACIQNLSLFLQMLVSLKASGLAVPFPWSSPSRRRYFRVILRLAIGNSILSTLATSRNQINLFVVSGLGGEVAAGLFAVAARCAGTFSRFFAPLGQIAYPEVMRLHDGIPAQRARVAMTRITIIAGVGAMLLALVGAVAAREVVWAIGGNKFLAASTPFRFSFAAELLIWASFHFNPYLVAAMGQKVLIKIGLLSSGLAVAVTAILAPHFGATGGALGVLTGAASAYLMSFAVVRRCLLHPPAARDAPGPNGQSAMLPNDC